jgi:hypothetical protein
MWTRQQANKMIARVLLLRLALVMLFKIRCSEGKKGEAGIV